MDVWVHAPPLKLTPAWCNHIWNIQEGCLNLGHKIWRLYVKTTPAATGSQGQLLAAIGSQVQPSAAKGSHRQDRAAIGSIGQPSAAKGSHRQQRAAIDSKGQPFAVEGSPISLPLPCPPAQKTTNRGAPLSPSDLPPPSKYKSGNGKSLPPPFCESPHRPDPSSLGRQTPRQQTGHGTPHHIPR
jgi:hypothetical protein